MASINVTLRELCVKSECGHHAQMAHSLQARKWPEFQLTRMKNTERECDEAPMGYQILLSPSYPSKRHGEQARRCIAVGVRRRGSIKYASGAPLSGLPLSETPHSVTVQEEVQPIRRHDNLLRLLERVSDARRLQITAFHRCKSSAESSSSKACWVGFAGICQLEAPLLFHVFFFSFCFHSSLFLCVVPERVRFIIKPEPRFEPPHVRQFHVTATAPRPRSWQNPQPDTSPPTSAALFCFPTLFPLVFIAFASLSFSRVCIIYSKSDSPLCPAQRRDQ